MLGCKQRYGFFTKTVTFLHLNLSCPTQMRFETIDYSAVFRFYKPDLFNFLTIEN